MQNKNSMKDWNTVFNPLIPVPSARNRPWREKVACLDDAFSDVFGREASPVKGQSLQQKDKKRRERNGKKLKKHPRLKT